MTMRIYCPACEWAPSASDRWICAPGCRTIWNTFETRARCPGCSKQWLVTVCHACDVSSLHERWYHEPEMNSMRDRAAEHQSDRELVPAGSRR